MEKDIHGTVIALKDEDMSEVTGHGASGRRRVKGNIKSYA